MTQFMNGYLVNEYLKPELVLKYFDVNTNDLNFFFPFCSDSGVEI